MVETTERDVTKLNPVSKRPGAAVLAVQDGTLQLVSATSLVNGIDYSTLDNRPTLGPLAALQTTIGTSRFLREDGTFQIVPNSGGSGSSSFAALTGSPTDNASLASALAAREPAFVAGTTLQYRRGDKTWATLDKNAVGLPNVANLAPADYPISNLTATALASKEAVIQAGIAGQYWDGTKTWKTLNAAAVGLPSVANLAPIDYPISTAQQTALNNKENALPVGSSTQYLAGDKTLKTMNAAAVGLPNVANLAPADLPVSSATATALAGKEGTIAPGVSGQYWDGTKTWKTLPSASGLTNPMNAAGDMIYGGASGTPTRLAKGSSNQVMTIDAGTGLPTWKAPTGAAASNANNVFLDSINGAPQRTVQSKARELLTPFDFGAIGNDRNKNTPLSTRYATIADARVVYPFANSLDEQIDRCATQALVLWMNANGMPVSFAGAELCFDRHVTSNGFWFVHGEKAQIGMQRMNVKRIDNGTTNAPVLTYPTADDPACLSGCAFYIYNPAYYMVFEDIDFYDGRFGVCFRNDPNSPIFRNCNFSYMNAGVFYWAGCQNARYYNCGGAPLGVLHISSATCVASDHPFGQNSDNFYSDNCTFTNEYGFNSFGIYQYTAFDAWFRDSIFRPGTVSSVNGSSYTYNDRNGNRYADDHPFCNATGRLIYMPFRNERICFSLIFKGQDSRGSGMVNGYIYVGTEIKAFTVEGNQYEQLFEAKGDLDTSPALGWVGSITSGTISEQAQISYIDKLHPFFSYTGRGQNEGFVDDRGLYNMGAQPNLTKGRVGLRGYRQGKHYIGEQVFPMVFNQYREQSRSDSNAPGDAYLKITGRTISDFQFATLIEGEPTVFTLPFTDDKGAVRSEMLLRTYDPFVGFVEIMVRNLTTGEVDAAKYFITLSDNGAQMTLGAAVNNGDTEITFTSSVKDGYRTPRYAKWSPNAAGTARGFTMDGYISGNKVKPINRVSGLTAPIASGAPMYRVRDCRAVQQFRHNWVALVNNQSPEGGIAFLGDDVIGIKNLMADSTNPNASDSLEIILRTTHLVSPYDKEYLSGPPTVGTYYKKGARVHAAWNATTPVREWECVTAGSPGTWRQVAHEVRTGTTAQRPTGLTTSDIGVRYLDTTTNSFVTWTGSAWL